MNSLWSLIKERSLLIHSWRTECIVLYEPLPRDLLYHFQAHLIHLYTVELTKLKYISSDPNYRSSPTVHHVEKPGFVLPSFFNLSWFNPSLLWQNTCPRCETRGCTGDDLRQCYVHLATKHDASRNRDERRRLVGKLEKIRMHIRIKIAEMETKLDLLETTRDAFDAHYDEMIDEINV